MARKLHAPDPGRVLLACRGLAAPTLLGIVLCTTAAAQNTAPGPPPLSPLAPLPPLPPLNGGAFRKVDHAVERTSLDTYVRADFPTIAALPEGLRASDTPLAPGSLVVSAPPDAKADKKDARADNLVTRSLLAIKQEQETLADLNVQVEEHPKQAQAFFKRGCFRARLAERGDPAVTEAAMADLSQALQLNSEHIDARLWRGWVASQKKDFPAAIADYSWVIDHHPERIEATVGRGEVFVKQWEIDRAIADFDRAVAVGAGKWESTVFTRRGWCFAAKGQHDRAIADLTRAIEDSVISESWVYVVRAESYQATGHLDQALADLDKAISLEPSSVLASLRRVEILMDLGSDTAAAWEAHRLQGLLPAQSGPYFLHSVVSWMATCQHDRGLAEIVQVVIPIETILPTAPAPHLVHTLAASLTGLGRNRAMADLDRCLAFEPGLSSPYVFRAIFNAYQGRFVLTCRDLSLFILKFDRRNYRWFARIDWHGHRFTIGYYERNPQHKAEGPSREPVADTDRKCIDLGVHRLLASGFGQGR